MIPISELTGALLDYYVARAEGIPAEQLTIRRVQRSESCHAVRCWTATDLAPVHVMVLAYGTDWAQGGPLIEKWLITPYMSPLRGWDGYHRPGLHMHETNSRTPLQAICRAVVRAAFGDEVEDVPVT